MIKITNPLPHMLSGSFVQRATTPRLRCIEAEPPQFYWICHFFHHAGKNAYPRPGEYRDQLTFGIRMYFDHYGAGITSQVHQFTSWMTCLRGMFRAVDAATSITCEYKGKPPRVRAETPENAPKRRFSDPETTGDHANASSSTATCCR